MTSLSFLVVITGLILAVEASKASPWPQIPAEGWALIGILVTALGAWVRERMKAQASPYEAMAARLERVEKKAEMVPALTARMSILQDWADDAYGWMLGISDHYERETGEPYFPPPPHPPPRWDRRHIDSGPPLGYPDRRDLEE